MGINGSIVRNKLFYFLSRVGPIGLIPHHGLGSWIGPRPNNDPHHNFGAVYKYSDLLTYLGGARDRTGMQCRSRPPREFLHMLNQVCWKSTRLPKSTCDRQRHPVDDCERKTTQYIMLRTAGRTKKQLVSGRAAATVCPRPSPPP